jgi:hypothetical protein
MNLYLANSVYDVEDKFNGLVYSWHSFGRQPRSVLELDG